MERAKLDPELRGRLRKVFVGREARENNANAESQIMIVAGSIAVIVLFVLLLVLLKVENSLRRSADVAEGAVVNN
jgi:hypothetical protein